MRKSKASPSSRRKPSSTNPVAKRSKAPAAQTGAVTTGPACFTEGCSGIGEHNCDGYCVDCYQAMLEGRAPLALRTGSRRQAAAQASIQVQTQLAKPNGDDDFYDDFDDDGRFLSVGPFVPFHCLLV
jgi:hypothetical protein